MQPSLTLPLLIILLLQWVAAWALNLLHVEAFVLSWAVFETEMCWVCLWAKQKPAPANATVAHRLSSQDLPVLPALLAKPA